MRPGPAGWPSPAPPLIPFTRTNPLMSFATRFSRGAGAAAWASGNQSESTRRSRSVRATATGARGTAGTEGERGRRPVPHRAAAGSAILDQPDRAALGYRRAGAWPRACGSATITRPSETSSSTATRTSSATCGRCTSAGGPGPTTVCARAVTAARPGPALLPREKRDELAEERRIGLQREAVLGLGLGEPWAAVEGLCSSLPDPGHATRAGPGTARLGGRLAAAPRSPPTSC